MVESCGPRVLRTVGREVAVEFIIREIVLTCVSLTSGHAIQCFLCICTTVLCRCPLNIVCLIRLSQVEGVGRERNVRSFRLFNFRDPWRIQRSSSVVCGPPSHPLSHRDCRLLLQFCGEIEVTRRVGTWGGRHFERARMMMEKLGNFEFATGRIGRKKYSLRSLQGEC